MLHVLSYTSLVRLSIFSQSRSVKDELEQQKENQNKGIKPDSIETNIPNELKNYDRLISLLSAYFIID